MAGFRKSTALATTSLSILSTLGVLTISAGSAHAADGDFYVVDGGVGTECTLAVPCGDISIGLSVANGTPGHQVIHVAAGDYEVENVLTMYNGIADSVTIAGAGAASTVVHFAAGTHHNFLFDFGTNLPFPVGISGLTLAGVHAFDGAASTGTVDGVRGYTAAVIFSGGPKKVTVTDSIIRDVSGGTGGAGFNDNDADADTHSTSGGPGGEAIGIQATGELVVSGTVVEDITGGEGGKGGLSEISNGNNGGLGGIAYGILSNEDGTGPITVTRSMISDVTGGDGGESGLGATTPTPQRSGEGGYGAFAFGIRDQGDATALTMTRSTIARITGGTGADGDDIDEPINAGGGGVATGVQSLSGNTTVLASTISGVEGGDGGSQGHAGDGGRAYGLTVGDSVSGTALSVTSSTLSAVRGGTRGTPSGGGGAAVDGSGFGVATEIETVTLAASILALPGASACETFANHYLGGYNVTSNGCGEYPNGLTRAVQNDLAALALNGNSAPAQTQALLSGDARSAVPVSTGYCVPDERNVARPAFGGPNNCAAGAFEPAVAPPPPPPPPPGPPAAKVMCDGKVATKVGTNGNDTITGTAGRDIIAGLGGKDTIRGLGGNDVICGGDGNDYVNGGKGSDKLIGGNGNDRLLGAAGKDHLSGGKGRDVLNGGGGRDSGGGGAGKDKVASVEKRA